MEYKRIHLKNEFPKHNNPPLHLHPKHPRHHNNKPRPTRLPDKRPNRWCYLEHTYYKRLGFNCNHYFSIIF